MSDDDGVYLQDTEHGRSAAVEALITRARALDELVNGYPENVDLALPELASILAESSDPGVVLEAVIALGHAGDQRAADIVLDHVSIDHEDAEVRLAIARALPYSFGPGETPPDRIVDAMIALTTDADSTVRDWSCFGLGQLEARSQPALDALAARLSDPHGDTRCEALWALAHAGDPRAQEHLLQRLARDSAVCELELKAAAELASPALHPSLLALDEEWEGDDDEFTPLLARALARCRPEAQAAAAAVESTLLERVNAVCSGAACTARTVGRYPATRLVVTEVGGAGATFWDWPIWDDEEPATYPLEQVAQSVLWATERAAG